VFVAASVTRSHWSEFVAIGTKAFCCSAEPLARATLHKSNNAGPASAPSHMTRRILTRGPFDQCGVFENGDSSAANVVDEQAAATSRKFLMNS
jgi:hypothetical protein